MPIKFLHSVVYIGVLIKSFNVGTVDFVSVGYTASKAKLKKTIFLAIQFARLSFVNVLHSRFTQQ